LLWRFVHVVQYLDEVGNPPSVPYSILQYRAEEQELIAGAKAGWAPSPDTGWSEMHGSQLPSTVHEGERLDIP
jgi:hypothetical protein